MQWKAHTLPVFCVKWYVNAGTEKKLRHGLLDIVVNLKK
jgi:hypothetical protein